MHTEPGRVLPVHHGAQEAGRKRESLCSDSHPKHPWQRWGWGEAQVLSLHDQGAGNKGATQGKGRPLRWADMRVHISGGTQGSHHMPSWSVQFDTGRMSFPSSYGCQHAENPQGASRLGRYLRTEPQIWLGRTRTRCSRILVFPPTHLHICELRAKQMEMSH